MGYEKFPELKDGDLLRELSPETRDAYTALLAPMVAEQLTEHGPLQGPHVRYLVNRTHGLNLAKEDIEDILWDGKRFARCYVKHPRVAQFWRTDAQVRDDVQPTLPAVDDYEMRYFELRALLDLARQDPAHLNSPVEHLRQLGVI